MSLKSLLKTWRQCVALAGLVVVTAALGDGHPAETLTLWPGAAPGDGAPGGEEGDTTKPADGRVAGRTVARVGNVWRPTMAFYPAPAANNTGAAVLVCPGGGYHILATDLEGTEVCHWLNGIGVNAALLKYRVPARAGRPKHEAPLQDAQRAMGLLRQHALDWKVDPARIGALGFSAGGHLAAVLSCQFEARSYPAVDAADQLSSRPDFTVLIYPAYLCAHDGALELAPELTVTHRTPPAFLAMSFDDPVHYENVVAYSTALHRAAVGAEVHLYPSGGHGYGLRPGVAAARWSDRAADWLRDEGWLAPRPPGP